MLRRPATRLSIQNEDLEELINVRSGAQQQPAGGQPQPSTASRIGLGQ
jgi:hypothetical protein